MSQGQEQEEREHEQVRGRVQEQEQERGVQEHTYLCIDLKSFYASVECVDRGLDPLTTKLVVADPDRTEKTICLAITPAMKALGIRNRCRVFEIPAGIEYLKIKPRMRRYMEVSADIYSLYLRYVSAEDIHVYSVDECFIDVTHYLPFYGVDARGMAFMLMQAVFDETGICATAGVGSNLFLAKVALDVTAKHAPDNIGVLDEALFREQLWHHRPITDIWNIGPGIAQRLEKLHIYDLAGVASCDPILLYQEFGVNAEYLIDHAWGVEPCTIADIHAYEPQTHSLSNGQALPCDYSFDEALIIVKEMVDAQVLELVKKHLCAGSISLGIGYAKGDGRHGSHTGGSRRLSGRTASRVKLMEQFINLYRETTSHDNAIRRIHIGLGDLAPEEHTSIDLFTDVAAEEEEHNLQQAKLAIKERFGKNALLMGASLCDKATARERNEQVGGHHA